MKRRYLFALSILSIIFTFGFISYQAKAANSDWAWPLSKSYVGHYEEGQQFGNTSYDRDGRGHYFHDGFDFGSVLYGNGPIHAVHNGKILYAGWDPIAGGALGDFIVLQAGDTNVIYQEFSRNTSDIKVSAGQTVTKGQVIGNFTSNHLHVGMTHQDWRAAQASAYSNNGTWLNPINILQGGSTSGGTTSPTTPVKVTTNVHYALHVLGGSWLSEVTNAANNAFAGVPNKQHDMLYVKVDKGQMKYRVHTAQSGWLPWVYKGDKSDTVNGVAGIAGQAIDGVQLYYTTPSGETLSQSYYRSQTTKRYGWLGVSADDGSIPGLDSYAGIFGEPLDHLQIEIATANPF